MPYSQLTNGSNISVGGWGCRIVRLTNITLGQAHCHIPLCVGSAQACRRRDDLSREGNRRPAHRPQLAKLMATLKLGDIVVVTKLDRLGRSTRELLELIERIAKAGAAFRSLGDPLWDTSKFAGPAVVDAFSRHRRL